ncbi:MAG: hypothetical protein EOO17_03880 [Chloroflexi bacterium]|nr:MAG: hypothetical protein EOO17_03880 [Chloroflexota bacterium]
MDQSAASDAPSSLIDMRPATVVQVALLGVILGAISWLVTLLLGRFVLDAIFCANESTTGICLNTNVIAGNIAIVFSAIGGVLGLVRLGVYRPMLVAIAAAIVLWGIAGWVDGLMWYESLVWTILIYALSYAALTWLVRPRTFLIAIILVLVVVIAARILPTI